MDHSHDKMRWTLCARDVCFKSELLRCGAGEGWTGQGGEGLGRPARAGRVAGRVGHAAAPPPPHCTHTTQSCCPGRRRADPPHGAPALAPNADARRQFFSNGKTLPVERGSSVHQPVMVAVGRLLGQGAWLHVFPEGKVQPGGDIGAFKQVRGRRGWHRHA